MDYIYKIIDGTKLEAEEIAELLAFLFRSDGDSTYKGDYYCGIATDPDQRFADHERDDWAILKIIAVVDCGGKQKACDVEKIMDGWDFECGAAAGRGPGDDTRYVYFVRMGKPVIKEPEGEDCDTLESFLKQIREQKKK